jgi:hypothetical protein
MHYMSSLESCAQKTTTERKWVLYKIEIGVGKDRGGGAKMCVCGGREILLAGEYT